MSVSILLIVVALLVYLAIFAVLHMLMSSRPVDLRNRVLGEDEPQERPSWRSILERATRMLRPLGEMIPRSPEEMSKQELRIIQAGIRRHESAILFHGIQVMFALSFVAAMLASGFLFRHVVVGFLLSVFLGAFIPDLVLSRMISQRKDRIQLALPDALDLTVVCVEAGLGLDQSLMRIGQELQISHPDLSDELHLTNLEINMGRSRADALRNLGRRTGVDDLKALCAVLIQTDRFGTSVGQALRVYAESLRTKRRQRAEERAAKLAVKMIPPMVLFIFPAMFVVIVGSAVISIIRDLLPTLLQR